MLKILIRPAFYIEYKSFQDGPFMIPDELTFESQARRRLYWTDKKRGKFARNRLDSSAYKTCEATRSYIQRWSHVEHTLLKKTFQIYIPEKVHGVASCSTTVAQRTIQTYMKSLCFRRVSLARGQKTPSHAKRHPSTTVSMRGLVRPTDRSNLHHPPQLKKRRFNSNQQ
jgi:hypothetical protein